MPRLLVALVVLLAVAVGVAYTARRTLVVRVAALVAELPQPTAAPTLDPGVAWSGEWYTVQRLDPRTIAIGEPRSPDRNVSYLLLGDRRAVLFDAGQGSADLAPVVEDLTTLPVTVIPSHLHFDHLGSIEHFATIALPDVAGLRAQAVGDIFVPTFEQFLGVVVDREAPVIRVTRWLAPGDRIDLGGRTLVVRHTPGHTPESISLWDPEREWLFAGDYLTPGELYAFLPGSSIRDYRTTARTLLGALPADVVFWGAHDELSDTLAPQLSRADLQDLERVLEAIGRGEAEVSGFFPRVYPVNPRVELWADIGDR